MNFEKYQQELNFYNKKIQTHNPQNQFEEKEIIGRLKVQSLECQNSQFKVLSGTCISGFDAFDVIVEIQHLDSLLIGEIKVRNAYKNTFKNWMLERKKIDELNLICKNLNRNRPANKKKFIPALINITAKDNIISVFEIDKATTPPEYQNCKRNNFHNSDKIKKQVQFFDQRHLIFSSQIF